MFPIQEVYLGFLCSTWGKHPSENTYVTRRSLYRTHVSYVINLNPHKKLAHKLLVGEFEIHLLHLSHTLHHHYHLDGLLEVAECEQ